MESDDSLVSLLSTSTDDQTEEHQLLDEVRDRCRKKSGGIEQILQGLDQDPRTTKRIVRVLREFPSKSFLTDISHLADHSNVEIRYHLAGVCQDRDTTGGRSIIDRLIQDSHTIVSLKAVEVLSTFTSPEASEIRRKRFRSENRVPVLVAYLEGLFRHPDPEFGELISDVIRSDIDETVKFFAVNALSKIDPDRLNSMGQERSTDHTITTTIRSPS